MIRIPLSLIDLPDIAQPISPNKLVKLGEKLRAATAAAVPIKVAIQPCGQRYLLLTGRDRFLVAQTEGATEIDVRVITRRNRRGR